MDSNDKDHEPANRAEDGAAKVDAAHFASLLDRCTERVHSYVLNKVRSRELADDLTQEALSKAWENQAGFDLERDELAWLITIASNVIADHVKSYKTQKRSPASGQRVPRGDERFATGETADAAARVHVDPANAMIDAEKIMALQAAIDRLDESKRQAIEFRRANFSYGEIASRMDISIGTVGSVISRAVKELREMLGVQTNHP